MTFPLNPADQDVWSEGGTEFRYIAATNSWQRIPYQPPATSQVVFVQASAPSNPATGAIWHNTLTNTTSVWDANSWDRVSTPMLIQTAAPNTSAPNSELEKGQLWLNPNTGLVNYWDGAAWVAVPMLGNADAKANGWVELPGRVLLQWGSFNSSVDGAVTVTFPKPFSGTPWMVQTGSAANAGYYGDSFNWTATGYSFNRADAAGGTKLYSWMAVGPA